MHNTRALELAHLNGMQPSLKRCWPPLTPHPCFRSSGSASGESLFKVLSLYVNTEQTETYIQLNSGTLKRYKRFRFRSVDCGRKLQHLERHADTGRTCRIRFMSQIICHTSADTVKCSINFHPAQLMLLFMMQTKYVRGQRRSSFLVGRCFVAVYAT